MENDRKKIGDVTFAENPLKFCQAAYDKAKEHNDKFKDRVAADRAFFDGHDEILKERSENPRIARSSLFIHESRTAIETRESAYADRLEEDEMPVDLAPEGDVDDQVYSIVEEKRKILNKQMQPFLTEVLYQLFMGGEQQPISVCKTGFEEVYKWVAEQNILMKAKDKINMMIMKILGNQSIPEDSTVYKWRMVERRPYTEWLDWDEFLHDPQATDLTPDGCEYIIHRVKVSWNKLREIGTQKGWKESALKKAKVEPGQGDHTEETMPDKIRGKEEDESHDEISGKYTLCEFWIPLYDEKDGEPKLKMRNVYLINNKHIVANEWCEDKTWWNKYPFTVRKANARLGCLEGISTVALTKDTQRAYSDVFNVLFDGLTYGIFKPLLNKRGNQWYDEPRYEPGAIFDVDHPDQIEPLPDTLDRFDFIPLIVQSLQSKIRQMTNAPDFDQSVDSPGQDEEKATKTRLRAVGSMRRLRRLFSEIRKIIIEVAQMYIELNQQYDSSWIIPMKVSVPVLSGAFTADEEFQKALLLYREAKENPLYNNPDGRLKLRELWIDVMNAARRKDINSRVPSEEDIQDQIQLEQFIQQIAGQTAQTKELPNGMVQA